MRNDWRGVGVDDLVRAQLAYLKDQIGTQIAAHGVAKLRLDAAAAQVIGLALHELATNAAKYGALSTPSGHVDIRWAVAGNAFEMTWTEDDGPPVTPPSPHGFGTKIITSLPKMTIDGEVQLDFAASGVTWRLTCPASNVLLSGDKNKNTVAQKLN